MGKMKDMNKKQYIKLGLAVCGVIALVLLAWKLLSEPRRSRGTDTVGDGTYLLTVDGYGVTEEEFLMFLRDQKAVTVNYFWVNYEMQPDDGFWTREADGETPIEYAKERALRSVVRAKEEFILAAERGILEYQDYNKMMAEMEAENTERADRKESGETFYGISQFTPFTYYQYLNGNIRAELERSQEEVSKPTKKQLKKVYEENEANLTLGKVYQYTILYEDGREEEISQNTREIGKADTITEDLIYTYFDYMNPGDTIEGYSYYGESVDIVFESVEDLGSMPFDKAEDSLRVFYARMELSNLIDTRVEEAEIVFDQERYDALTMP